MRGAYFDNISVPDLSLEGAPIAANGKFVAIPWKSQLSGGAVVVVPDMGQFKKFTYDDPLITGHKGVVTDLSFSPFLDNVLATASADATVKIWVIPHNGLNDDMIEGHQHADLKSHTKKVSFISWNPTTNFTIASSSTDCTIKVWDIKNEMATMDYQMNTQPVSLEWNHDGELIGCISKDKMIHIYDPRVYSKAIVTPTGHNA